MAQSNKRARSPVYGVLPDLAVAGPAQKKLRGEAEPEKRLAIFKKCKFFFVYLQILIIIS